MPKRALQVIEEPVQQEQTEAEVIPFPKRNKNYRQKRGEFVKSLAQRRGSELSWIAYCTEGLIGNITHALTVNAFTMDKRDLKAVNRVRALVRLASDEFREYIAQAMPDTNKPRARRMGRIK